MKIDRSKTIYENFLAIAKWRDKNDAIYYENKVYSYADFLAIIHRIAFYYNSIGLQKDDLITLVAPNTPETVASFYAALQLGLRIHILHPLTSEDNVERELKDKGSKLLVTVSLFLRFYSSLIESKFPMLVINPTASLPLYKRIGFRISAGKRLKPYRQHKEIPDYQKVCKGSIEEFVPYDTKEGHIILSSGGTTGISKSIILNDFSFLTILSDGCWFLGDNEEEAVNESMLAALPMFHGYGLTMGIMAVPFLGGKIGLLSSFRTKKVIQLLKKGRLTTLLGVPTVYEALLKNKHFKGKVLKPIRNCWVGGDFISPSLLERFDIRLREAGSEGKLMEGYGLTEAVNVLAVNRLSDYKTGSIGKPIPGVEVKIIDEQGKEVSTNQEGEIAVGGDTLMVGYYHKGIDPFIQIDGKRYLKTGDMGKKDEDGFIYFISRFKRIIKKKGMNVYPLSIEKTVSGIEGVEECAYLGETYKGYDDTALYVELSPEADPSETKKKILDALHHQYNKYEWPDFIFVKEKFEHTSVLKIDYKILSQEFHAFLVDKFGPIHN
jgi:long-chain acyl-CoA synthetase